MVLYFSGTGNSLYVAKRIADEISEPLFSINDAIKKYDFDSIHTGERVVIVTPTYAWRIPKIVEKWILKTKFLDAKNIYFVMTCGGDIAGASKYNQKLSNKLSLEYMGTMQIIMPENYLVMFESDSNEKAKEIIASSEKDILYTIYTIKNNEKIKKFKGGIVNTIKSGIVNGMFYTFCVKADDFYATKNCISCGKCATLCPLNNIKMVDGKPNWGKDCTHCLECISSCPKEAIEYGKHTKGQNRYRYDKL